MAHKEDAKEVSQYFEGTVQYKEYIDISVGNPEICMSDDGNEKYVVYPVTLKTNSLSFAAPHTRVCRRYSEFLWLYRYLRKIPKTSNESNVPSLPRRQLPFWNFEEDFLLKRRKSLEVFLSSVVRETVFLSSTALHLFLQTDLPTKKMDEVIKSGATQTAIRENVKLLKVDSEFLNSLGRYSSPTEDGEFLKSVDSVLSPEQSSSSVFWRCEKNTLQKVASLPNFTPVLKDYEAFSNNNTESIQP